MDEVLFTVTLIDRQQRSPTFHHYIDTCDSHHERVLHAYLFLIYYNLQFGNSR